MKKKIRIFITVFFLIFLTAQGILAQENPSLPPENERRGMIRNRRMPPRNMHPQSFFVKKIEYTLDDKILTLDIHFNGPVDPFTIENSPFAERRKKNDNIESITYTYNRTADRVKIVIVLKNRPDEENFSFSLEGVESFGKGPLHNHFFENIEPSTIYEFEEDGTWKEY